METCGKCGSITAPEWVEDAILGWRQSPRCLICGWRPTREMVPEITRIPVRTRQETGALIRKMLMQGQKPAEINEAIGRPKNHGSVYWMKKRMGK